MLTRKTVLGMLIVIGAVAIGGGLVLAQNLGPGPTASLAPGQPQVKEPDVKDADQVLAETGAAASPAPDQPQVKEPPYKNADQILAEIGAAVPGFGGYYLQYDPPPCGYYGALGPGCGGPYLGIAYVYMLDTSQQQEARRALEMLVGAERVSQEIREIRVLQGQYSMAQLSQWYALWHALRASVLIDGIYWTDLAEGKNRIELRVTEQAAKINVEAKLQGLGIPREAVDIVMGTGIFKRETHTLDSQFDLLLGGPKIEIPDSGGVCTLGYVTDRVTGPDTVRGIITASHCTTRLGGPDGAVVFQPTLASNRRIGKETIDPDFFTGGICPAGKICRNSDAAFITLDAGSSSSLLGRIARTTALGSKTIDHANPEFRIVNDTVGPVMGILLTKSG